MNIRTGRTPADPRERRGRPRNHPPHPAPGPDRATANRPPKPAGLREPVAVPPRWIEAQDLSQPDTRYGANSGANPVRLGQRTARRSAALYAAGAQPSGAPSLTAAASSFGAVSR
jgi:hypothetical protein